MTTTRTLPLLLTSGAILSTVLATAQTARVQVIHNCADAAAATVDVYVNGGLAVDDFAFRTATPFIDLPAGVDLEVGIAPGTSNSADDAIATFNYNLADGGSYILVANGIVSPTGYAPAPAFGLDVFAAAQETSALPLNTDVLVMHGSTDAPVVDVAEIGVPAGTVVDDLAYGDFAGYLALATTDYVLQVQTANGTPVVAYEAPLAALELGGAALTVLASGFLNPAQNSNGPAFGLWVALPSGGDLIPLPEYTAPATARVQVIHNCADGVAAEVDVYINETLALDDFAFRTATPFIDLPAGTEVNVGIAPSTSTGVEDIIATFTYVLDEGGSYILVASGIVSGTGYEPAPAFDLKVFPAAREAASMMGNTDVLVMHGSTDAPTVDVGEEAILAGATIVDDLPYGEFDGYIEVPTADYALQVRTSDGTPVATYAAPLATLGLDDAALTVLASGFLTPANNSNGAAFGLYVALSSGGALVPLPLITNVGMAENLAGVDVRVWPNPTADVLNIALSSERNARLSATLTDLAGRRVLDLGVLTSVTGENRLTADLQALQAGSYLLRIADEKGASTLPVQVVR